MGKQKGPEPADRPPFPSPSKAAPEVKNHLQRIARKMEMYLTE